MSWFSGLFGGNDGIEDFGRVRAPAGSTMPPLPAQKPRVSTSSTEGIFTGGDSGGLFGNIRSIFGDYLEYDLIKDGKFITPNGYGSYGQPSGGYTAPSGSSGSSNNMLFMGALALGAVGVTAALMN